MSRQTIFPSTCLQQTIKIKHFSGGKPGKICKKQKLEIDLHFRYTESCFFVLFCGFLLPAFLMAIIIVHHLMGVVPSCLTKNC